MATNREKGVVFIGLGRKPEFYEHIAKQQFKDSKNIELRAVGRAIPRALKIAQKFIFEKIAQYTRLISQPISIDGKENVLVIIKLKEVNRNQERPRNKERELKDREKEARERERQHRDREREPKNTEKRDKEPKQKEIQGERTQKTKKKYVEKDTEKEGQH